MANILGKDGNDGDIIIYSSHANTAADPAESHETVADSIQALTALFPGSLGPALSAGSLSVVLASDYSLPTGVNVIGQVIANAGTNLNTSLLAREAGGFLEEIAGAVNGSEVQADIVGPLPTGTNTIGDVGVVKGAMSTGAALVTTAGTPVQLTAVSTTLEEGVTIQWNPDNTGRVYIGGSSVGNNLAAPFVDSSVPIFFVPVGDLSEIYLNADTDGDGVLYLAS